MFIKARQVNLFPKFVGNIRAGDPGKNGIGYKTARINADLNKYYPGDDV